MVQFNESPFLYNLVTCRKSCVTECWYQQNYDYNQNWYDDEKGLNIFLVCSPRWHCVGGFKTFKNI